MNKFVNEFDMVAVLVNKDHGIGWSTCCYEADREGLMYDPAIVNIVMSEVEGWEEEVINYCKTKYPDFYCVPYGLDVEWVRAGTTFYIQEYDGWECVCYPEDLATFVA
jgi:hypothetical protein